MSNGKPSTQKTVIDTIKKQERDRKKNSGMVRISKSGINTAVGSTVALNVGNVGGTPAANTDAANRQLSNVSDTAIDDHLVPKDNNDIDLGSDVYSWRNLFLYKIRIYGNASGTDGARNEIYLNSSGQLTINAATGGQIRFGTAGIEMLRFTPALIAPQTDGVIDLGQNPSSRFRHLNLTGNIIAQGSLAVNGSIAGGGINTTTITTQITSTTSDFHSSITNIGSSSSNTVNINSRVGTSLIPTTNGTKSLGGPSNNWLDIYSVGTIFAEDLSVDGSITMTGTSEDIILGGTNYIKVGVTTSTASAGAATLPANPVGFFFIKDTAGALRKVPYYA